MVCILINLISKNNIRNGGVYFLDLCFGSSGRSGICPPNHVQLEKHHQIISTTPPLPATSKNIQRGKKLYRKEAKPTARKMCHGIRGNGNGRLARGLETAPRRFTCKDTMQSLSDGQLFWIIKNGSKGTAMPAHKLTLGDGDIRQIIYYLKSFTR